MTDLFCDFETRSRLSVFDVGAWKYAAHPSTYPLMFVFGSRQLGHKQWLEYKHGHEMPANLRAYVEDPTVLFHAHNAGFEIAIYSEICVKRWGWIPIPLERWRDTAAKGCHANQPRALDNLCDRLGTDERKDKYGKFLLNTLSVPQKTVKVVKYSNDTKDGLHKKGETRKDSITYLKEHGVELFEIPIGKAGKTASFFWNNDPDLLDALAKYNVQDVIAEEDADGKLPDLPEYEQKVWEMDARINRRGMPIDRELCGGVAKIFAVESDLCNAAIAKIAYEPDDRPKKKQVEKCTQRERIVDWVNERVNFGESLAAELIDEWLVKPWGIRDQDEADRVHKVFELRRIAGGTGVKKYWAAMDFIQEDDRIRGQLLYYGAATGRWAGKGIQPHNILRLPIPEEIFFEAITRGDHAEVATLAELCGTTVIGLLKTCVRGMIRAEEGKQLVVSDFAGIESRVLQWFAGNEDALRLFREGADMYVHAASTIYNIPYEEMMEWSDEEQKDICKKKYKDKRQIGKIAVLALGYAMGGEKYQGTCEGWGVEITREFADQIVYKWRSANPLIADKGGLWNRVERACKAVIKNKKMRARIDDYLKIYWDLRGYLCVELPSGRVLYYYKAEIYKSDKGFKQIRYLDGGKSWADTYGGKLVENIVQAASRDLLVHSAFVAEQSGLTIIGHVHDELICEEPLANTDAYGKLHAAMETLPSWAAGLPLAAATYAQRRYTK